MPLGAGSPGSLLLPLFEFVRVDNTHHPSSGLVYLILPCPCKL